MADAYIEDGESLTKVGKKTLVHVVRGDGGVQPHKAGEILDTYFCRNGENHFLDVKWVSPGGIRKFVEEIRIKPYYRRQGWITLQDAYLAEKNESGYQEYLEFSDAQRSDPVGMRGIDFPEDKLPVSVQSLRKKRFDSKASTKKWESAAEQAKPTTPIADPKTKKPVKPKAKPNASEANGAA